MIKGINKRVQTKKIKQHNYVSSQGKINPNVSNIIN